ncbi:MAG: aminoglycoside adenylyltransferase domain-containing protein [Gemmatimonadaceae bacterium]
MAEPAVDHATSHPEVNALLAVLLGELPGILTDKLVGVYLFGSAPTGDFDRESDVDVVVVTSENVASNTFTALAAMHERLAATDSWCATQLEVSYIPTREIRRYRPPDVLHPRLDRGRGETLHMMSHDADWVVQRFLIRERGSVLMGPSPDTLIDPVSADDLRRAMRELLGEWLAPLIESPPVVRTRGYQAFLVLSACRILYTLKTGDVVSKRAAALWAEEALDSRWTPLIRRAWIGRQNPDEPPRPDDLSDSWSFISHALEIART